MQNCKFLSLNEVEILPSLKRNKQPLSNFDDWNLKKVKQIEGWDMIQGAFKKFKKWTEDLYLLISLKDIIIWVFLSP